MEEIKTFNSPDLGSIRIVVMGTEPWFVGKDVAEILGYSNPSKALNDHIDNEDKLNNESLVSLGQRGGWLINESGLYSLILSSKLPTAKKFKRWVTAEVLPTIRKDGGYLTPEKVEEVLSNPDTIIKLATDLKNERAKRQETENRLEEAKPKVLFANAVTESDGTILIGDLAKFIKQNGRDMGQKRLFEQLRNDGFLIKQKCSSYNMPTQRAMDMGLFKVKESSIVQPDGVVRLTRTVKVTGKGQIYFINKYLGEQTQQSLDLEV